MQIIFYVLTFITALSILSYQNLTHFVEVYRFHLSYLRLMGVEVPRQIENKAFKVYERIPNKLIQKNKEDEEKGNEEEKERKKEKTVKLKKFFNLMLITEEGVEGEDYRAMCARLLENLYGNAPSIKTLAETNPDWAREFIDEIAEGFQDPDKLKRAGMEPEGIAQMGLSEQAQALIYDLTYESTNREPLGTYIKIIRKKEAGQTAIFLARYPLLKAIIQDEITVQEILSYRKKLHQELLTYDKKEEESAKAMLGARFASEFQDKIPLSFRQVVNFRVSTTTPTD